MKRKSVDYNSRIEGLLDFIHRKKLHEFLFMDSVNINYYTGLDMSNGLLLIGDNRRILLTDFRYIERAKNSPAVKSASLEVKEVSRSIIVECESLFCNKNSVGFDAECLSHYKYIELNDISNARLVPVAGAGKLLRAQKDIVEIDLITKAQRIAEKSLKSKGSEMFITGNSEENAAAILDAAIRLNGASGNSFSTMVACGKNASKPHSEPSKSRLKPQKTIILDFGARYKGYCSDMTRSVFLDGVDSYQRRLYKSVLKAQDAAFAVLGPGMKAEDVDLAARSSLEEAGLARYFGHGLGHGVGLDIHEFPSVAQGSQAILKPGMIITIEPGVYIPGYGGIRIEELVLITEDGYRSLTRIARSLKSWIYKQD